MKNFKKVLALVLVVATLLSFATVASAITSKDYKDAADIDYTAAVDVLSYIGVLNGYGDGTFKPEGEITRAEAAKIIAMFSNGSTSINTLYASANPFTDVEKGNWAESYIAYCYKTGIVGGVGNGKFAPAAKVTGIQFIKMALTVLGYDAKKEGLEGASWAVNTLALAKKAGLLAGLPANFKYEANLKRQEAAQIMLNALNAYIVDYGYEVKNTNKVSYITTAGAVIVADETLAKVWGIGLRDFTDAFERPGTQYYNTKTGATIGSYLLPAVKTYTTKVSECQLVEDLGIAKTNITKSVKADFFRNGSEKLDDVVLQHTANNACLANRLGYTAQGTLTEVFDVSNWGSKGDEAYRVTSISTWLAKVDHVTNSNTNRPGHATITGTPYTTLHVYDGAANNTVKWDAAGKDFAAGDMVLVTYSYKDGETGVQSVEAAKSETAQLTGYDRSHDADPYLVEVGGTDKAEAAKFWLNRDAVAYENLKSTYVFYYDSYGNVIGMAQPTAASTDYAVVDSVYYTIENGAGTAKGSAVGLDAKATDVKVAKIGERTYGEFSRYAYTETNRDYYITVAGNEWAYDVLYTVAVNSNGSYTYTDAASFDGTDATIDEGDKNVRFTETATADGSAVVENAVFGLNAATKILIHENDGSYTAATLSTVGTLSAGGVQIVDKNNDGYADIVYLYNGIVRKGDTATGYVVDWTNYQTKVVNGTKYYVYNVYFDGARTSVYFAAEQTGLTEGLYNFSFKLSDDKIVLATATAAAVHTGKFVSVDADNATMRVDNVAGVLNLAKDVKVYFVDRTVVAGTARNTVVACSLADIYVNDGLTYVVNSAAQVTAIYITTDSTIS